MTVLAPPSLSTLTTADGITLTARSWLHPQSRAVVALVHGFAASTEDPAVVRQAEALQADGFDVLCYDSRGHGDSAGLCTIGNLESNDVAAGVATVVGDQDLQVIVLGASMGAIAALRFAATAKEHLAGVVCVSSPSAWRPPRTPRGVLAAAMTRTGLGRALAARYLRVRIQARWANPEPPQALISRIAVPIALVHGERDRLIRPSEAREPYEACRGARRLELVRDMGHAFDPAGLDAISAAVEWTLSGPAGPGGPVAPVSAARSVGWSDKRRFRRSHPRYIFRQ